MAAQNEFTPRDFFELARQVAEHEAELKIKLAKAGVRSQPDPDNENKTR